MTVLAAARVGAVVQYDDSPGATGKVVVRGTSDGVVLSADGEDIPWDVAMRAGRTDPAGCADVPGDAVLSRHGADTLTVLDALGASDDQKPPVPDRGHARRGRRPAVLVVRRAAGLAAQRRLRSHVASSSYSPDALA